MPKTKEREAEKSSKSSSRPSAKVSSRSVAKPSARANASSAQAKPVKASSSKLPAAKPSAALVKSAPAAPAKPSASAKSTSASSKPATASQTKPASSSHSKAVPAAAKSAPQPTAVTKSSSKSSAKIALVPIKTRASDRLEKPVEKPAANLKTPFTKDELGKWRQQLIERRNEISSDIAGLEKDAMEAEDGHTTPNHIAERGSDADLQDVSLGIAGEEKDIIWQIDRALRKIEASSPIPFGLCEYTKEPISRNRLQLIPWTPLSIEGANYMEENNLQVEDLLVDG